MHIPPLPVQGPRHRVAPRVPQGPAAAGRCARAGPWFALLLACVLALTPQATANEAWAHDAPERFTVGLDNPVDIAFGGDGHLYYAALTEREVRRVALDTAEVDEDFVVTLPEAHWENGSETGLFALALHPQFHENGILYVSYTAFDEAAPEEEQWTNVLSRLTLTDPSGQATEEVLLTRPGGQFHNGGRLLIVDEYLFWTTGDASDFREDPQVGGRHAQDDDDLRGKVLRLDLDGNPAPDNPWGNEVYTKGHRNVFGIAWDPQEERILVTENGNARRDYIYILEAGNNHGWPECEGSCDEERPEYTDPIWESNGTIAPTGAAWFRGAFWFGSFNQGDLYQVHEADEGWVIKKAHHTSGTVEDPPRILSVAVAPEGDSLWYSTWNEVWRIPFPAHEDWPPSEGTSAGPYWWDAFDDGPTGQLGGDGGDGGDDGDTGRTPAPGFIAVLGLITAAWALVRLRRRA